MLMAPVESAPMLKLDTARMQAIRRELGLTQAQAAEKAGMTLSRWNDIETGGRSNVTIETLGHIAQALDCDPRELLTDDKRRPKKGR